MDIYTVSFTFMYIKVSTSSRPSWHPAPAVLGEAAAVAIGQLGHLPSASLVFNSIFVITQQLIVHLQVALGLDN